MDILKEIGNIGAGHAATALSTLLNKKIDMSVPDVKIVSFDEMIDMAGGAENVVAGVFLRIEGDAPGSMFLSCLLNRLKYSFVNCLETYLSVQMNCHMMNLPYPHCRSLETFSQVLIYLLYLILPNYHFLLQCRCYALIWWEQ